jgi:ssDNA-binding Zn-finger/Zn-ribbon topoisomerase 1
MKCPKCGAEMHERNGRYGRFLGCPNWRRCNGTRDVNPTDNSTPTKQRKLTGGRAGLRVIFPETINYAFRQRKARTDKLSIYRHDASEAIVSRGHRSSSVNEFPEFLETDQEWMSLEDYCLERDLLLDHSQLIKQGKAIAGYHRTHSVPGPHKLPHDRYGTINGYRRCSLDRWYEEFVSRQ